MAGFASPASRARSYPVSVHAPSVRAPVGLRANWKILRRMFAFLAPVKFHTVVTTLLFIAYTAAEVLSVYLLKPAINIVEELGAGERGADVPGLWVWLSAPEGSGAALRAAFFWLALAMAVRSVLAWAKVVAGAWQSMSMVYYMRAAVYDRLQRVGFAFHDLYSTGQLINRALGDLHAVRMFVNTSLHSSTDILFSLLGYFGMIVSLSPLLGLAALVPLPFWIWAIRRYAVLSQPIYDRQLQASDEMVRVLTENVAGVHVVRAFATEDLERAKFKDRCGRLLARMLDGVTLQQRMTPLLRGIAAAAHVGLFSLGAILVQRGELELGALISIGVALGVILAKVQQINGISDAYQRAMVSGVRLFEILDSADTTPERPDAEPLRPGGGAVRFTRVSFGYEPGKPVLHDVSFHVPAGSKVALVGPTGSGKTTVAALLARFYDPDLGYIEIDGRGTRDATLTSVRQAVGYVFQENYLFSDTIARNIAYADLAAPLAKIQEAARISGAQEFIERLPRKYETSIGEFGATLSGGQKQRLAIARALLHNPRLLVLDDALSAVDPETEAQIRQELERLMAGRTVFLITSRISTCRRADHILVLEHGRITQRGTHAQLLGEAGYYRSVAASQFSDSQPLRGHDASHMDRMTRISSQRSGRIDDEP